MRIIVLTGLVLISLTNAVKAGDWRNSWLSEKSKAVQMCTKIYEDYQLQAICMQNEKDGYYEMQGNFGLPSSVATKAKARCAKVFNEFQLQVLCMQNEKDGYDKMQEY